MVEQHLFNDGLQLPRTFVRVLMMFMFATEESLGFDPNVRRIPPSGKTALISYVYRLAGVDDGIEWERYYRTQETICDCHRLCITGRSTRAWKAHRVTSFDDLRRQDDKTVVIREVWLDLGARTEKRVQAEIFADLDHFSERLVDNPDFTPPQFQGMSADMRQKAEVLLKVDASLPAYTMPGGRDRSERMGYEKHFLTILCDSLGARSRNAAQNYVRAPNFLDLHHPVPKEKRASVEGSDSTRNSHPSVTEAVDLNLPSVTLQPTSQESRAYRPKQRYFLAYDECCLDLDRPEVTSLQDVFIGLEGCLFGAHNWCFF